MKHEVTKMAVTDLLFIIGSMVIVIVGCMILLNIFFSDSTYIFYFTGIIVGLIFGIIIKAYHEEYLKD